MGRASAGGCEAVRGGDGTKAVSGWSLKASAVAAAVRAAAGASAVGGAHSRFAEISEEEEHLVLPSPHRNLKHENAGTIVTSLATPYFTPPTVEATWVPCPLHPVPSRGRMPLTAWHEAHAGRSNDCEEGEG